MTLDLVSRSAHHFPILELHVLNGRLVCVIQLAYDWTSHILSGGLAVITYIASDVEEASHSYLVLVVRFTIVSVWYNSIQRNRAHLLHS